jgi:tryptophan synthase alpha chain
MNRIQQLFQNKSGRILSVYFTAGYPEIDSTARILKNLAGAGADLVEIGIPFSDPMADGPVIQQSNDRALKNGMSLKLLFRQLADIRQDVDIPLLLMGYINPVFQFGVGEFCHHCKLAGIDGVILPDLPPEVYQEKYQQLFDRFDLLNIFLISPQTSTQRIRTIDGMSRGFIYMVSSSSTTGVRGDFSSAQLAYFQRINNMHLKNPRIVGFGISSHESFTTACQYAQGAIIGSAFMKMLGEKGYSENAIGEFVREIKEGKQDTVKSEK